MPTSRNSNNNRLPGTGNSSNPSDTAKQNYTSIRYGNDHGSISFGQIHKQGDVTAAVILEARDGRHQFSLDKDGQREGWTSSTSPGNFQVECGSDNEESEDSLILNAKNGNILIIASNGKIRMQATDIELVAVGEGGSKGNIVLNATENIKADAKKVLITAKNHYKLVSPGTGEIVANSQMQIYSSILRGVTDACAVKDSKVGGQRFLKKNNKT